MNLIRSLYLNDRFFYLCSTCIFLFFVSFLYEFVFLIALVLLAGLLIALTTDLYFLYRSTSVSAQRIVGSVLSLNEDNDIVVVVTNLKRFVRYIRIIDEIPFQFNRRDFKIHAVLEKETEKKIGYQLRPLTRGAYEFGDLHVFVSTQIGLATRKETTACATTVSVYPSILQMVRQELRALNHPSFTQGENKQFRAGQSYEFDQVKAYTPGDDTRNINWKATSTQSEVMVNVYEAERSQQIYSIIDKSRVMKLPFNGLTLVDYAINATLAFSNIVMKKQDKAGLIIFSKHIGALLKADRGARHLKKVMYSLYKEKYDYSEANYEALYAAVKHNIPNRSLLFLYTNFDSIHALERNIPALKLMNRNHLLVVVFFENSELENYSKQPASSLLDIYQQTIAKKFILEKNQIYRELQKHGITAIKTTPEQLSTSTINMYLDLKSRSLI